MKRLRMLTLVLVLGAAVPVLPACSRPITVESVQRDVATNGTRLLNATIQIQDAIYASVKAKILTPQQGLTALDATQTIGERGQVVASDLNRLDLLLQSGQPDGALLDRITAGLTEMSKLFPDTLAGSTAPQVSAAVKEVQTLIKTIQDTVAKIRSGNNA